MSQRKCLSMPGKATHTLQGLILFSLLVSQVILVIHEFLYGLMNIRWSSSMYFGLTLAIGQDRLKERFTGI